MFAFQTGACDTDSCHSEMGLGSCLTINSEDCINWIDLPRALVHIPQPYRFYPQRETHILFRFLTQTRQPAFCNTLTAKWQSSQTKIKGSAAHLTADDSQTAFSCSTRDQKINSIDKLQEKNGSQQTCQKPLQSPWPSRSTQYCVCLSTASRLRLVTCRCAMDCANPKRSNAEKPTVSAIVNRLPPSV